MSINLSFNVHLVLIYDSLNSFIINL